MLNHILPLLVSMHNLTICVERILDKAQFDTVSLVHLNTTKDIADMVHQQLIIDTDYAWIRFDMSDKSTLHHPLLLENLFTKIFFVFFLDNFIDWVHVYKFFIITKLNFRSNQINIVNKYPTMDFIKELGKVIAGRHFFNAATLFWNTSGSGSGLDAYRFSAFEEDTGNIPLQLVNDQCYRTDIHDKLFPSDKLLNFNGYNVVVYGQTEPPRIARTVEMVNRKFEHSIGGHDVLIADTIFKYLNATPKFKLMMYVLYMHTITNYSISIKPVTNTEQRFFNVPEITQLTWNVATIDELNSLYTKPAIDINSQQMRFGGYMDILRMKDYTYLYPHDTDNFVIIVPKRFKSKTDYGHILKSPLVFVWIPVTTAATVVRFIFNKIRRNDKKFGDIFLQTFGLSLGISSNASISTAAENLLLWSFCLGTMLSGMLLSSSMFQGFTLQLDIPTISDLKELELSGLEVQAPLFSESVTHFFENISLKLKLNYRLDFDISQMIFNRNMSNAYVIGEGKFNILFSKDPWHVIARFGFEHLSYKLRLFSAVEDTMNTVLQRCVDHGIINYLVAKNRRLLSGTQYNYKNVIATAYNPLTISDMQNLYLLYALGILLSTITLIAENIYCQINMIMIQRKVKSKTKITIVAR